MRRLATPSYVSSFAASLMDTRTSPLPVSAPWYSSAISQPRTDARMKRSSSGAKYWKKMSTAPVPERDVLADARWLCDVTNHIGCSRLQRLSCWLGLPFEMLDSTYPVNGWKGLLCQSTTGRNGRRRQASASASALGPGLCRMTRRASRTSVGRQDGRVACRVHRRDGLHHADRVAEARGALAGAEVRGVHEGGEALGMLHPDREGLVRRGEGIERREVPGVYMLRRGRVQPRPGRRLLEEDVDVGHLEIGQRVADVGEEALLQVVAVDVGVDPVLQPRHHEEHVGEDAHELPVALAFQLAAGRHHQLVHAVGEEAGPAAERRQHLHVAAEAQEAAGQHQVQHAEQEHQDVVQHEADGHEEQGRQAQHGLQEGMASQCRIARDLQRRRREALDEAAVQRHRQHERQVQRPVEQHGLDAAGQRPNHPDVDIRRSQRIDLRSG
eukprot:scaffold213_cov245-Pinguiococcus_pyrenoidosus.AAC.3